MMILTSYLDSYYRSFAFKKAHGFLLVQGNREGTEWIMPTFFATVASLSPLCCMWKVSIFALFSNPLPLFCFPTFLPVNYYDTPDPAPREKKNGKSGWGHTCAMGGGWGGGYHKADFSLSKSPSLKPSRGHPIKKFKLSKATPSLSCQKTRKNLQIFFKISKFSFEISKKKLKYQHFLSLKNCKSHLFLVFIVGSYFRRKILLPTPSLDQTISPPPCANFYHPPPWEQNLDPPPYKFDFAHVWVRGRFGIYDRGVGGRGGVGRGRRESVLSWKKWHG